MGEKGKQKNDAQEEFEAWVTKYALSSGIEAVRARIVNGDTNLISYMGTKKNTLRQYANAKEWFRTPEEALRRAEEMREEKIASLKKSIAKLEKITFVAPYQPGK